MTSMQFMYATDENFVHVLATSLYSLLKAHTHRDIQVHIVLAEDVTSASRRLLQDIGQRFSRCIQFHYMPDFNAATHVALDLKRYSLSMFSRLAVGSLLPVAVQRVIYLDADTLICDDLYALWETDMGEKILGAVNDCRSAVYCGNLGIRRENCYINSGVLLIDLNRYRSCDCENRLLNALAQMNGLLEFPDNDLICKVLQHRIYRLPLRYNVISVVRMCSYEDLLRLRHPSVRPEKADYDQAQAAPAILHFTTFFMMKGRPWMAQCDHPDAPRYLQARMEATGQPPIPAQKVGSLRRAAYQAAMVLPRRLSYTCFGLLHSFIKPLLRRASMKKCREELLI